MMNTTAQAPPPARRLNNLALAFQEAIVVILRTRFRVQRVENAEQFRTVSRQLISSAAKECGALGYSSEATKMAVYAIIGFLDESILRSGDPTFSNWHQNTLQQEMFGSQIAGEVFFRTVSDLLNRPASAEVADVLELHALCLLLGYRGKYEEGDSTEVHAILRRIRDKLASIRNESSLFRVQEAPRAPSTKRSDPWVRKLAFTAFGAAIVTAAFYVAYILLLGHPASAQSMLGHAPSVSSRKAATGMEIAA